MSRYSSGGLIIVSLCAELVALGANYKRIVPDAVRSCVNHKALGAAGGLDTRVNPYYLRGDFDGDGRPDYAVAIIGKRTKRAGVAICHASGFGVVLRGDTVYRPPFSDMPGDNFLSSDWSIIEKSDAVRRLSRVSAKQSPTGGAILMTWDDSDGLVYFDGIRYRWITSRSIE